MNSDGGSIEDVVHVRDYDAPARARLDELKKTGLYEGAAYSFIEERVLLTPIESRKRVLNAFENKAVQELVKESKPRTFVRDILLVQALAERHNIFIAVNMAETANEYDHETREAYMNVLRETMSVKPNMLALNATLGAEGPGLASRVLERARALDKEKSNAYVQTLQRLQSYAPKMFSHAATYSYNIPVAQTPDFIARLQEVMGDPNEREARRREEWERHQAVSKAMGYEEEAVPLEERVHVE